MNDEHLKKLFWYLIRQNDAEPLARYIENGGDLSQLTAKQRKRLARLVRRKSPRERGEKLDKGLEERNWQICLDVVCLKAFGLPAQSSSGQVHHKPSLATDACSVVANRWGLSEETVYDIWGNRDTVIQHFDAMYKGQQSDSPLPLKSSPERDNYIEHLRNAWKDPD